MSVVGPGIFHLPDSAFENTAEDFKDFNASKNTTLIVFV